MKANELRIGNLVLIHNHYVSEVCIIQDDLIGVKTVGEPNAQIDFIEPKYISPIPLTEQWMLEFGFKEKNYDYKIPISECELVKLMLIPHDEFPSESSVCVIQSNEDDSEEETVFLSDIKYVHQLQNLYFSLCGKELVIN